MTDIPGYLNESGANIPKCSKPVYWDLALSISTNVAQLDHWIEQYTPLLPQGAVIDEAAIMTPSPWHTQGLLEDMVNAGWTNFNGADDLVYTNPFGTRYFVRYEFLSSPARNYRLEVMNMSEGRIDGVRGFSPLHAALWTPDGVPTDTVSASRFPVPHLSFKPVRGPERPTLEQRKQGRANEAKQTWRKAYSRAVDHLQGMGCIHAQTCQSTYGNFGYFLPNDAERQLYLKPRVNLRDEYTGKSTEDLAECGQPKPCGHAPDGGNHPVTA